MTDSPPLKNCGWCGTPMECVRLYTIRVPLIVLDDELRAIGPSQREMIQARCLLGHWYGGPLEDVQVEVW